MVQDKDMSCLIKAANKDIRNWTAESRELFDYAEEYDPAEDDFAYGLSVSVDYRLPGERVTELENESVYYNFTTADKNIVKYMEDHPQLMSGKNIIADDDPILGMESTD